MHDLKGNSLYNSGYGCETVQMIEAWREAWSSTPGTTDPQAPFGLVTLAPSGGEGGFDMSAMRWAQTANYGTMPNKALPNTFLAHAYVTLRYVTLLCVTLLYFALICVVTYGVRGLGFGHESGAYVVSICQCKCWQPCLILYHPTAKAGVSPCQN